MEFLDHMYLWLTRSLQHREKYHAKMSVPAAQRMLVDGGGGATESQVRKMFREMQDGQWGKYRPRLGKFEWNAPARQTIEKWLNRPKY